MLYFLKTFKNNHSLCDINSFKTIQLFFEFIKLLIRIPEFDGF